uniref:Omega-agatoxin-1A n=1 Tax=Agelenopsis aperta TaxID=6908 RepID=TOG1A_AGEAP|nr:RecName: Full=Omega-agatoxin-1A; AltName: Full=Omega-agatoxin IA; Short=Omega-Aga-IA; Contains: RecName: Full=Omega-agatoxin-1A major chain; Contains: RecName: Full=Omega-agatoxin-1A minor chain; Flags: Precursor [Agelenopsis aperta]
MMKFVVFLACLFVAAHSFAVEGEEEYFEAEVPELERAKALPPGSVCDGNESDCKCYGKWHKCRCPWKWHFTGEGPCTCEKGMKHTCITKLHCPNKAEWGLDWRSEESERSPC